MPRVSIRADGSHDVGLGHIYRARTLGLALADMDWDVAFHSLAETSGEVILRDTDLEVIAVPKSQIPYVSDSGSDVVVIDCLDTRHEKLMNISAKKVSFDDTGSGLDFCDAVINSVVFHYQKYDPARVKTDLFEGPEYMILQPELFEYQKRDSGCDPDTLSILIACGGTDDHQITPRYVAALNDVSLKLEIRINLGPAAQKSSLLMSMIETSPHSIHLLDATASLFSEMSKSDFVLCAGGFMLCELAALGIPAISIAAETHEIANSAFWQSKGTLISIGSEATLNQRSIKEAVIDLATHPVKRKTLSRNGKSSIDGKGLDRCLKIVSGLIH